MKFVFVENELDKCWVVEAADKHNAIAIAVGEGYAESMHDFYYGLEDGQISIHELKREINLTV